MNRSPISPTTMSPLGTSYQSRQRRPDDVSIDPRLSHIFVARASGLQIERNGKLAGGAFLISGVACVIAGGVAVGAEVAASATLLFIAGLVVSIAGIYFLVKEYDKDPEVLRRYRREALPPHVTFSQLVDRHGVRFLFRFLSPQEVRHKLLQEWSQLPRDIKEFFQRRYPLRMLGQWGVLSSDELGQLGFRLSPLLPIEEGYAREKEGLDEQYQAGELILDHYRNRLQALEKRRDEAFAKVPPDVYKTLWDYLTSLQFSAPIAPHHLLKET